jgi:hypothetical protein
LAIVWVLACSGASPETESTASAEAPAAPAAPGTETALAAAPLQEQMRFSETQTPPTSTEALILRLPTVSARTGGQVCLPMQVEDFENLIGLQYSLRWDTTQIAFLSVGNFQLPGLTESSFGLRFADRGVIATSWIDGRLSGVSLPDGTAIYELCYEVLAPSGTEVVVQIANRPVSFEVIDTRDQLLRLRYANGRIRVE